MNISMFSNTIISIGTFGKWLIGKSTGTGANPPLKLQKGDYHSSSFLSSSPSKKGCLYAFHISDDRFKVGKSSNLQQRIRSYKTIHPEGTVYHTISCSNIDHSEKILHYLLKLHGYHVTQEIFNVPSITLKSYMNLVDSISKIVERNDEKDAIDALVKYAKKL
jgi:hypothetical protein